MKASITLMIIAVLLISPACKKDSPNGPEQPKNIELPSKGKEVISRSNAFGIDLFRMTALTDESNMMLSPLSASTALTMLLNGCNGETYNQVRDMLGYDGLSLAEINSTYNVLVNQLLTVDPDVKLALANAVFYRNTFTVKPSFLDTMDQSFQAEVAGLDFNSPSALETINGWAKDNTFGKIDKVLGQIDPQAVMFLMNALYFKGVWTYKFGGESFKDLFSLQDGSQDSVVYMKDLMPVKMFSTATATAVELPYGSQNFAMDVIVPKASFSEYLANFKESEWSTITSGLDAISDPVKINMIMPRFKFSYEKVLNDQLKAMGMTDAFVSELANLSGISDEDIYVSFVKQNTFVEVNEDGTEAAAVTTIGIDVTAMPDEPETFMVSKPFIFAIRERVTNTVLFVGKVGNPAL